LSVREVAGLRAGDLLGAQEGKRSGDFNVRKNRKNFLLVEGFGLKMGKK